VNAKDRIAEGVALAHRWGLGRARDVLREGLLRRDRRLPDLRELRNLEIPGPGGPLRARLYTPMAAPVEGGPLLIYFHGGGFVLGDLDSHDALCWRLADVSGVRVISCLYRLAPEHAFPAQLEDALAAAQWTVAHAASLGADTDKIAIGGDSAGGYLAITTARTLNAKRPGTIKAQVLLYPLMTLDDDIWATSLMRDTRAVGRLAVRYIGIQLAMNAPSLLADGALAPLPTVIVSGGTLDPCRSDVVACADRLEALGAPVVRREYAALIHGFANLTHASAAVRRAVKEIGELMGEVIRAATSDQRP
jgi:acetyl esterase